jgi:phage shock protein PspC (stress-responsive transcriptional regulator)
MSRVVPASTVVTMSPTASDPRTVVTDMWQTRPTRRETDRKIAGVAAALARRYDVDPVLMRIGFVVSAFCGVGVLLYLAAWAALAPDFNDPPRGGIQTSQMARVLVYLGIVLASLHALHQLADGQVDFLVGLLVIGGLLYLLQVTRGEHRADVAYAGSAPGMAQDQEMGPGIRHDQGGPTGPSAPPRAFGASAPFIPGVPRAPREPRSRLTPVTIALALLAAGITGMVMLASDTGFPGARAVVAVPLAVIGIGLLIGSFTRGGRGLVLIALPLMLVGFVVNWAPTQRWRGAGDLEVVPASVSAVAPAYEQTFGDVELDLRHLDLTAPGAAPATAAGPPPPPAAVPGSLPAPGVPAPTGVTPTRWCRAA